MSKRNLNQTIKRQIKNEIAGEVEVALKTAADQGTVVTSRGDCIAFRIETVRTMRFVHIGGYIGGVTTKLEGAEGMARAAKESASAAMLALGYTRS